jgi:hypothetical protein
MGADRLMKEVQNRTPLQTQRLHNGQNALYETAADRAMKIKRTATPEGDLAIGILGRPSLLRA